MHLSDLKRVQELFHLRRIPPLQEIIGNFVRYNAILPFRNRPFLPRTMTIYVTYRCNMRCRMCGIWKQDPNFPSEELSQKELSKILSDPLFSKLEFININGGEPNLREDLVEVTEMFINQFKRLKAISLNSNGLPPEKTRRNVEGILNICQKSNIQFSVSLSLHRIGKEYDRIAGIKDAYVSVKEAFDALIKLRKHNSFYISANCVITNLNLSYLEEVVVWGQKEKIPVNFSLAEVRERFNNLDMEENVVVRDKDTLAHFLRKLGKQKKLFLHHALRYTYLADTIELGEKRKLSCHYALGGVILGAEGKLYYCTHSRAMGNCKITCPSKIYFDPENLKYRKDNLMRDKCLHCPSYTFNRMEVEKDLLKFIQFMFSGK